MPINNKAETRAEYLSIQAVATLLPIFTPASKVAMAKMPTLKAISQGEFPAIPSPKAMPIQLID
jgi:hypothetical protein